ncbi:MAG: hypothetical protein JWQ40_5029 [Segetibacter sp.]|nr:hypothetical protein [Segetibacter sp.]
MPFNVLDTAIKSYCCEVENVGRNQRNTQMKHAVAKQLWVVHLCVIIVSLAIFPQILILYEA